MRETYCTERVSLAADTVFDILRDGLKVEDEGGEQLPVVSLPLADRFDLIGSPGGLIGLLGHGLGLSTSFLQFPGQGRGRGSAAADQARTTGVRVINLDDVFFGRRLAAGRVALLTGDRALPLPAGLGGRA